MLSGKDWQPHKIQGWTPNLVPAVLNKKVADQIIPVERRSRARHRARAGDRRKASSAAFRRAAHLPPRSKLPRQAKTGDVILAMLPDTGERYLSTFLFEGINEGTDVE